MSTTSNRIYPPVPFSACYDDSTARLLAGQIHSIEIKVFRCGPSDQNWAADCYVNGVRFYCSPGFTTRNQAIAEATRAITAYATIS